MEIRLINVSDAKLLSKYYKDNVEHFKKWEPEREKDYHSISNWKRRLRAIVSDQIKGKAALFIALDVNGDNIIAHCALTNIILGAFQACTMGYGVAKKYEGKGVMIQTCNKAIEYAFDTLGLNRIMANYMPHNVRSASLLKKMGFTIEGKAKNYLKIDGVWQDHVLTSLVNPKNCK